MAENPYAPPQADVNKGAPTEIARPDMKMPGTVIATICIVSLITLLALVNAVRVQGTVPILSLIIYGLILVGLIRGHALAWQWGIVIPTLFAIFAVLGLGFVMRRLTANPVLVLIILVPLALYISIPVLLSFRSSRIYFGLQCPKCGEVKGRAASFLFHKRRCGACRAEWTMQSR